MDRRSGADWIGIRQRRVIDGREYYADRLHETQQTARAYAQKLECQGKDVHILRTATEGGHRGYAVFFER